MLLLEELKIPPQSALMKTTTKAMMYEKDILGSLQAIKMLKYQSK